jgi:hypothetical protein
MYKIIKVNNKNRCIIKGDNEMYIPFDDKNVDYKEYLAWLEEGNTPTEENIEIDESYISTEE